MTDLVRVGSLGKGGVGGVVKQVRVERPRPLKIGGGAHPELSLEDLLVVMEGVRKSLVGKGEGEQMVGQLQLLSANLKICGPTLEISHKVSVLVSYAPTNLNFVSGPDGQVQQLPDGCLQVRLLGPGGQGAHA